MERDVRRDRGQWRGCYAFRDIICDGDNGVSPRRDGGLKMGEPYYFYYELDGSVEAHDPSLPSTNNCPYLPGQTVNTVWVPVERSLRKRSASLSSMRDEDMKTLNPNDKFVTPQAAPVRSATPGLLRLGSAPLAIHHKRSARSLSPGSSWSFSPRKLFSRKASSSSLRENERAGRNDNRSHIPSEDTRNVASRDGSRSRDMSPESLRRFLCDDTPLVSEPELNDRPSLAIPEDIAEENEDDDNFATSTTSESMPFTVLSPPPTQHSHSQCATPAPRSRAASLTPTVDSMRPEPPTRAPPRIPGLAQADFLTPKPAFSLADFNCMTPTSPQSPASNDLPSFYHSEEEDDTVSANEDDADLPPTGVRPGDIDSSARNLNGTLSTYSLPQTSDTGDKLSANDRTQMRSLDSPVLVAGNGTELPVGNTSLLTSPIPNSGLDELMNELGWMADIITGRGA